MLETIFTKQIDNFLKIYYPIDFEITNPHYQTCKETIRLNETILNYYKDKELIEALSNNLKDYIFFQMGGNFPSYNFQKIIYNNQESISVISIYISFILPFYIIKRLEGSYVNKNITINSLENLDNYNEINFIENKLNYKRLSDRFLKFEIKNGLDYFNAIFTDNYRIMGF
jgi:hypothetical protein